MKAINFLIFSILCVGGVNAQVGFGTTSPSNDIDVESSSATATAVDINNTGGGDPKINFQLSGTTTFSMGIDNSDADKFKIGTSALENDTRFTIDASGNCGIGNTSPGAKLDVDGSAIFNESGAAVNFRVESDGNTDMLYVDGTNNKVGIGTSTPTGRFEVYNTTQNDRTIYTSDGSDWISYVPNLSNLAYNDISSAGDMGIIFSADNSSAAQANGFVIAPHINIGSAQGIKIMENGNVGIGTPAPSEKLDIESNDATKTALDINNTGGGDPKINFQLSGTSTFSMGIDNSDADKFKIGTSALENNTRFTIDASGNVGIGTSSPLAPFHVVGSGCSSNLYERGIANFYFSSSACGGGVSLLKARGSASAPTTVSNGDYMGDLFFGGYDGTNYLATAYIATQVVGTVSTGSIPTDIVFETGSVHNPGSEDMRITSAGNVGIGTSSPGYKLTVNGQPGANGYTAFTNYSDSRLKTNISSLDTGALSKILQLRPVSFQYNQKYLQLYPNSDLQKVHKGFIAQEIRTVFPEMVSEMKASPDSVQYLDLDVSHLQVYLVKAMQEQQAIIQEQQAIIESLKKANEEQNAKAMLQKAEMAQNAIKVAELENKMNAMLLLLNNKTELTVKQ